MTPRFCGLAAQVGSVGFSTLGLMRSKCVLAGQALGRISFQIQLTLPTTGLNCMGPLADFANEISQ